VRTRRNARGSGLVEFVLTFPVMLFMLSLAIDVGRLIHLRLSLDQIAHDAARFAARKNPATGQYPSLDAVKQRVEARFPGWFKPYSLQAELATKAGSFDAVRCRLSCSVRPFLMNVVGAAQRDVNVQSETVQPK
jgi:hypothetical protein